MPLRQEPNSLTSWPIAEKIAAYAVHTRFDDLPIAVVEKTKLCIIDFLGSTLAPDVTGEASASLLSLASRTEGNTAWIYGKGITASLDAACFINSVSATSFVCNDTFVSSSSHPGISILPSVLALADAERRSGKDIIVAAVVGYEIMSRLGQALITPEVSAKFRPSGLLSPTAAAAAIANLWHFQESVARDAICLATNNAAGFNAWAEEGTSDLNFHTAHGGRAAIIAAQLACNGVHGAASIIEGRAGILAAFGALERKELLVSELGHRFDILDVVHKPAPTCIYTQGACVLAAQIGSKRQISPTEIQQVEIRVTEAAARYPGCDNSSGFRSSLSARLSLQFSVVSLMMKGAISQSFGDDFNDPAVLEAAKRCTVVIDPEMEAAFPRRNGTKIAVLLKSGENLSAELEDFNSMTVTDVEDRFLINSTPALGPKRAHRLLKMLHAIDCLDETHELFALAGGEKDHK